MTDDEPQSISIILSPTQVDAVVRAASHARTPSISSLIAGALQAPLDADGQPTEGERASANGAARARSGFAALDNSDPRLSRSLLRGLSILTCFGPDAGSRGIVELARELGMSPSTTHRYASTLVQLGLLERCPETRKYRLPGV